MKLKLANVRLSFPQLWEAATFNGEGKATFSASFIIDPADPQIETINAVMEKVAADKWGAKAEAMLKQIRAKDASFLHDGDNKPNIAGYPGNFYISARNPVRPTVLDRDKSPLIESDGKPYGGCYVNAVLDIWAQENGFGKRINASLMGVQFVRDGEAFTGGGSASVDDFDEVDEGADAYDFV